MSEDNETVPACTINVWTERTADKGDCTYCDKRDVLVKPEPFGGEDACQECWEAICYGE